MKFLTLVAVLALSACSSVNAAECTKETLAGIDGKGESDKVLNACRDALNTIASGFTGNNKEAMKTACQDKTCMNALEAALKIFPDCEQDGINYKTQYTKQMESLKADCKKATEGSSASTATVGLSVATAAAVAVFAQL